MPASKARQPRQSVRVDKSARLDKYRPAGIAKAEVEFIENSQGTGQMKRGCRYCMEQTYRLASFHAYDFVLILLLIAPCRCTHCLRRQYIWLPWVGVLHAIDHFDSR